LNTGKLKAGQMENVRGGKETNQEMQSHRL
jgi:hypothetical protein